MKRRVWNVAKKLDAPSSYTFLVMATMHAPTDRDYSPRGAHIAPAKNVGTSRPHGLSSIGTNSQSQSGGLTMERGPWEGFGCQDAPRLRISPARASRACKPHAGGPEQGQSRPQ